MNKLCLLSCLVLAVSAQAQSAPEVVFTGDNFMNVWQQTPQFTANMNWIGAGIQVQPLFGPGSKAVDADFQAAVVSRHPVFVQILTGASDITTIRDAIPQGYAWHQFANGVMGMVGMAQKAGIKVILGNLPTDGEFLVDPQSVQLFNAWLAQYGLANNIPVVNYHDALCNCVGSTSTPSTPDLNLFSALPQPGGAPTEYVPNDAGYALITQMAQIAIQTYGLTIKSGYLINVETRSPEINSDQPLASQVNNVGEGTTVQFTPVAQWSDGVSRPMLNQDYNGLKGTWSSTNPAVMYVNQHGQAFAYNAGKADIWFRSASGVYFSPWTMTVTLVFPDGCC
jgi:hypothetical protein